MTPLDEMVQHDFLDKIIFGLAPMGERMSAMQEQASVSQS